MNRLRVMAGVAAIVALPVMAIGVLHGLADRPWFRIDWSDLPGWLASTPLTDVVSALARLVALAVAYWSVAGTLTYLAAVFTRNEHLTTRVAPFTFPVVRRLADRMVAGTIAMGVMAVPLVASTHPHPPAPPPAEPVADAYVPETRLTLQMPPIEASEPDPDDRPEGAFAERPVTGAVEVETTPAGPGPTQALQPADDVARVMGAVDVTVAPGDHLWMLAERRLAATVGRAVEDHEIAPYWRATVDENLSRLRSGDPDLIHPGETITLPDLAEFIPRGN